MKTLAAPASSSAKDWDARYRAHPGALFGDQPNDYLRAIVLRPDFAADSALMLADGDGRNGAWLATRGVSVTAIDLSCEATRLGTARDRNGGVTTTRIAADLAEWTPRPGELFGLVTVIYLQGGAALRQRAVEIGARCVAPDGWFVLEAFAKGQAGRNDIGPPDADKLYSLDELRTWLTGLDLVEALAGQVQLDEGARHRGIAEVVRVCARRPPADQFC